MKTYNDIYLSARNTLRRHGVEAYALEARILVSCAAEKSVQELLKDLNLYTTPQVEATVTDYIARRLQGEPVAYPIRKGEDTETLLDAINEILEAHRQDGTLAALSEKYFGVDLTREG